MSVDFHNLRSRLMRSPYYREKLFRAGLTPNDLRYESLPEFPFTTRQELAEDGATFLAYRNRREQKTTHAVSSTGTGGQKLTAYRGESDELRLIRLWEEAAGAALPATVRILFVCTMPRPKQYLSEKRAGVRQVCITRVGVRAVAEYAANPSRFDVLTGTPHGLLTAARLGAGAGISLGYSTALPLDASGAADLDAALAAPHLHAYSMSETGPIARRCPRCGDAYHVYPDMLVETVTGRLCITKLNDSVFPLLRYLTDDRGETTSGAAPCGFRGTTIFNLTGRKNERFFSQQGIRDAA